MVLPFGSPRVIDEPVQPGTVFRDTVDLGDAAPYGVGLYRVEVTSGDCSSTVWVKLTGRSPFTTVAGIVGTVAFVGGLGLLIWGVVRAVKGKRGLVPGLVGGAIGGFGALVLAQQHGWIGITDRGMITWIAFPALGGAAVTQVTALFSGGRGCRGARSRSHAGPGTGARTDPGPTTGVRTDPGRPAAPPPAPVPPPPTAPRCRHLRAISPSRRRRCRVARSTPERVRADRRARGRRRRRRVRTGRRARARTGCGCRRRPARAAGVECRPVHARRAGRRRRLHAPKQSRRVAPRAPGDGRSAVPDGHVLPARRSSGRGGVVAFDPSAVLGRRPDDGDGRAFGGDRRARRAARCAARATGTGRERHDRRAAARRGRSHGAHPARRITDRRSLALDVRNDARRRRARRARRHRHRRASRRLRPPTHRRRRVASRAARRSFRSSPASGTP